MKVVHITCGISHSSAPLRLCNALDKVGIESVLLVKEKNVEDDRVVIQDRDFFYKIENRLISGKEKKLLSKYDKEDLPFSFGGSGMDVSDNEQVKSADVIHLHWINGQYLSYRSVSKLVKMGKPVVWTFHDSWPMTGGCHVRFGCERFMEHCGKCPQLNSEDEKDISYDIITKKEKYYFADKFVTVCPSKWMKSNVCKSRLFSKADNRQIYNPLDVSKYKEKDNFQDYSDKKQINILYGSSGSTTSKYKGYTYFEETMKRLKCLRPDISKKVNIRIFGTAETEFPGLNGYKVETLGYIMSDDKMAEMYRDSDIYVFPSLDDNLPGTVMECLASGTPVVCFDTCGIPEMVINYRNGYVAKYKDSEDMATGIGWIYDNNIGNILGKAGRRYIEDNFSEETIAPLYKSLYEEICSR